jgi:hypothetical protein
MATEENENKRVEAYSVELLKDLRRAVRSIDVKGEEILDELKDHLSNRSGGGNEWRPRDLYDDGEDAY